MKKQPFIPLLLGGDINVYSMARAFHEAYGIPSVVFGKYPTGPCCNSKIIELHTFGDQNDQPETLFQNVCRFAQAHPDETILLIGCGDSYVQRIAETKGRYPDNVVTPYIDSDLMNTLIHKERFYALCEKHGIDYPNTFIHHKDMGHDFSLPFDPPFIVKPSNGVAYWEHPFPIQNKVYKAKDRVQLNAILDEIYGSGYPDTIVIQDFIPGDDTFMRVLTNYSDRNGTVQFMCLGHVLLEEHTPHGIGNHAVIVNEVNESLSQKLRDFLNAVGFVGFSNFDIKYDQRDGKFKVFEINVRQGRSNFYVTGAGYNLARMVVDDWIDHREMEFTLADKPLLWRVVPQKVADLYIAPPEYREQMKQLIADGHAVNPLFYSADRGFLRRLRLFKTQREHFKKYKKYMDKPSAGGAQ
ncbi:MAG: ATP-grasp domain-containing protein [Oscillospiraceae bacterium]|nr:ATP-grasp domain-containing protein [Oscillospiraceae bacterium]